MHYQYTLKNESYEQLSSGRVLYNAPGLSAFPVRLASELTQQSCALLESKGLYAPYNLYDPCCGGGYLLTTIGFLHGEKFKRISGSDIADQAISVARKNLSLLQVEGMKARVSELQHLIKSYNKVSHQEALGDAIKLLDLLKGRHPSRLIDLDLFQADITGNLIKPFMADLVITDLPYGDMTHWKSSQTEPTTAFLENLPRFMVPRHSIAVIVTSSKQKLVAPHLKRIKHFRNGHRRINFYELP